MNGGPAFDSAVDRRSELWSRWRTIWRDPRSQAFWKNQTLRDTSYMVGMLGGFVLLLIEAPLWLSDWPPPFYAPPGSWLVLLALFAPIQGWLLDQYVELKTSGPRSLPIGWRCFRLGLASVPLLGFYTLPVWREILTRRFERILSKAHVRGTHLDLRQPARVLSTRVVRSLLSSASFPILMVATHFGLPVLWALWLSVQPVGPNRLPLCVMLHLLVATCFVHVFGGASRNVDRGSLRSSVLKGLPALFLLGLPGMLLGFIGFLFVDRLVSGDRSLVWSAYASRSRVQVEGGPMRLQDWTPRRKSLWNRLRDRMSRSRPRQESGKAERSLRAFYRLKTLLLAIDVVALAWIALAVEPSQERIDRVFQVMHVAAGLGLLGLLLQAAGLIGRLFGGNRISRLLEDHPYGHFLFVSQAALVAGLAVGAAIGVGQLENAGQLIAQTAACCGMVAGLLLMIGRSDTRGTSLVWSLLFLVLIVVGVPVAAADDLSPVLPWVVGGTVLANLALGLGLGGWLLRPFGWSEILKAGLPFQARWGLGFLLAGAVLPFGGLMIPVWIFIRHRWWPEWERSWWGPVSSSGRQTLQEVLRDGAGMGGR